ncbi:MAG: phosphate signaling complex protein PhoU [Paracoccaceae bacterium]|nr:phosphate signaling complex protein PhoU [Paracoccaceae bacterium]MDE2912766.1 phosphate signaling complex protein PhoU [Paracoccaceae bacterium]
MEVGPHIVSAFDKDLVAIQARISEMGGLAEDMLSLAVDAIRSRDVALAEQVIRMDDRLDALELEVEDVAQVTIALRQPMAQDLRDLLAALKIATTLERIGDLSENIARRAIYLAGRKRVRLSSSIVRMGRQTSQQLSEVLNAYIARDTEAARGIWLRDVELDDTYNALFREVVTYMMEDPRTIGLGSQMLFVAKNLERIGDHTTHIAESVYYIVEGEPLGDDRPKGEPLSLEILE